MKAFRIFFIIWGLISFLFGFKAPHQFATSAVCFIMVGVSLIQERIDKEWEKSKSKYHGKNS